MNNQNNQTQGNTGGPNRGGPLRPVTIQPGHVIHLVQALKNELAAAKAAENDRAKAQQHYAKAEDIKQVLLNYQAQQKSRAQQQQQQQQQHPQQQMHPQPNSAGNQVNIPNQQNMMNLQQQSSSNLNQPGLQAQSPNLAQQIPQSSPAPMMQQNSSSSGGSHISSANLITMENFNKLKARLSSYEPRIQQLEESKKNESSPDQIGALERQIGDLKTKFSQEQKYAIYMKNQLIEQAKTASSNLNSPQLSNTGSPAVTNPQDPRFRVQQQQNVKSPFVQSKGTPQQAPVGTPQNQGQQRSSKSASPSGTNATATPSKLGQTPGPGTSSSNLAGITRPSVPSIPISSTINVKPPTALTLKPNNANRASLSTGVPNGLGSILGTPAITKLPSYDLSTAGTSATLPDNGGRVLTKRKLSELVNSIGADEGDGKTTIDGDVEELLLDLADEFVTSVTSFACRLAKHRKADSIDVKDVQLHLERNWNIRIPGYAMDDIKAIRKWQPSTSYNQKLSGVEISKSVNGNIN
ncbi:uncharacterized protein PRCAT00002782001 [Priceomyces carsonii]|uniref:uncharacterized protein n=1 Tax=Priceomyces carsonii TaxID=28549 RepID=UPI002ED97882|nr:unnamed protein product [Priceomyces carsonii]